MLATQHALENAAATIADELREEILEQAQLTPEMICAAVRTIRGRNPQFPYLRSQRSLEIVSDLICEKFA